MTGGRADPHAFGPPDRPLLGWIHRPPAGTPRRNVGLVICKPFGYEAVCAHRSMRHFADAAAARGVPALRFDYDGTGDSAGTDSDPGRWQAWCRSVGQAIDELRRVERVDQVLLFGIRLGATIAATAAADRADVVGLIAVVPVLSGRAWLRETNALEIAMRFPGAPPGLELPVGYQESVGFVITEETRASLLNVDLVKTPAPPAPQILVLERDDLAPNTKWVERLGGLGAAVELRRVPGYAAMMFDPHDSVVPRGMIDAMSDWIELRTAATTAGSPADSPGIEVGPLRVAPGVTETAALFGRERNLFGIVAGPADGPTPSRAIVLLNAGAITHIGPSRLYVDLARKWAALGYLVLRFDQAGIGDSLAFAGEEENIVYAPSALRGVREALDFLRELGAPQHVQALGLCSGAYHALKAAADGLPLNGIAIVNPLVFFWKAGMSLAYPPYQVAEATARYKKAILRLEKWKKLLSGKVDLRDVFEVGARRASAAAAALARNVARTVGLPLPEDLGAELDAVARRGVALRFVFATGDPGEDLLRTQAGWALPRLERASRIRISRIDGPNHAFTPVWSRVILTEILEAELEVR